MLKKELGSGYYPKYCPDEIDRHKSKIESFRQLKLESKIIIDSFALNEEKKSLKGFFKSRHNMEQLIQIEIELDKIKAKYNA